MTPVPYHTKPPRPAVGIILPSSNRIVERIAHRMMNGYENVDICFARVPYAGHPPGDYDLAPFLAAAGMLADARVRKICWNATRGALLAFDPDRRLCARLQAETGIPVTTTALETLSELRRRGLSRITMIAQGGPEETAVLVRNFAREGIEVIATRSLSIRENFDAARLAPACMIDRAAELARLPQTEAVLIWSTNLDGSPLHRASWTGPVVLDSATIGMKCLLDDAEVE